MENVWPCWIGRGQSASDLHSEPEQRRGGGGWAEKFQVVAVSRDGKQLVGATAGTDTSSVDDPRTRAAGAVVILDLTKNEVKPVTGMAAEQHVVS